MRGQITYRQRAQQLRNFTGLLFGSITPTDIDGFIEYKNRAYIIIEMKLDEVEVPFGQMLALERLCDDLQKEKQCLLIVAQHNYRPEQDIDFANCQVSKYRSRGKWITPESSITVKKLIDEFLKRFIN